MVVALLLALACRGTAQSYRLTLNRRVHIMQDGSRVAGWHPGRRPLTRAPAGAPPAALVPPVPGGGQPQPMPLLRGLSPGAALAAVGPQTLERNAAYNWDGRLAGSAPADPRFVALAAWLTTRYDMPDPARHERIWHYYQDERPRGGQGPNDAGTTVDAFRAANAVARYVWTTRDSIAGRLDWNKIDAGYDGPAQISGTGIFYRRTPGGAAVARVTTPAAVTIGAHSAQGGWFHAREAAGPAGWISVYWITFP